MSPYSAYKEREIAEELAQACRVLGAFDMMHGATGHVPAQPFVVKASGHRVSSGCTRAHLLSVTVRLQRRAAVGRMRHDRQPRPCAACRGGPKLRPARVVTRL